VVDPGNRCKVLDRRRNDNADRPQLVHRIVGAVDEASGGIVFDAPLEASRPQWHFEAGDVHQRHALTAPPVGTAAAQLNSVGNVTLKGITELDGTAPQQISVSTGVLFEVSPNDQRPDHPVGGALAQSTETSDLVDTPLRDIEETLEDVEVPRDYLGPRTLRTSRQRRVRHDGNTVCHSHIGPALSVNETHPHTEADHTRLSGAGKPVATLTFGTSGLRETGSHENVEPRQPRKTVSRNCYSL